MSGWLVLVEVIGWPLFVLLTADLVGAGCWVGEVFDGWGLLTADFLGVGDVAYGAVFLLACWAFLGICS
jgi:hypothetical protein